MAKNEAAWDNDRIVGFLRKLPDSEPFIPAAVIEIAKAVLIYCSLLGKK